MPARHDESFTAVVRMTVDYGGEKCTRLIGAFVAD